MVAFRLGHSSLGHSGYPDVVKMRVMNWYRNDNIDAFRRFCDQNRNELISIRLIGDLEPINGVLYDYRSCTYLTENILYYLIQ